MANAKELHFDVDARARLKRKSEQRRKTKA